MIDKDSLDEDFALALRDVIGGSLSVHRNGPKGIWGIVVSDREGATAGYLLDDDDRAALAAALTR